MRERRRTIFATAMLLFVLFLFLLLLANAQVAAQGVRRGLSLCVRTLIPSIFPFLVLAELLIALGAAERTLPLFSRPVTALFGISAAASSALLLGVVCGFPVGSTTAIALYKRGEISREELERLMLFCNNPSCGFLIGTVGAGLFGSLELGVALFAITLSSSLLFALLLRLFKGAPRQSERGFCPIAQKPLDISVFTKSVTNAFAALLQICAFVLFFSCIGACFGALSSKAGLPPFCVILASGLLEMTSGIQAAYAALDTGLAFVLSAFFTAFSGLCICFQFYAVVGERAPRAGAYLAAKLTQGGIAFLLALGYVHLFAPTANRTESVEAFALSRPWNLGVFLLLCPPLLYLLFKRKKRSCERKTKRGR